MRIDHISIAVRDLERAMAAWQPVLGRSAPDERYLDRAERIRVARYRLGGVGLELMEATSPASEVARFIGHHGEGVMLVALGVDHARTALDELERRGYPVVGPLRPFRDGEYGFLHPRAMNGVLLELIDGQGTEWKGSGSPRPREER